MRLLVLLFKNTKIWHLILSQIFLILNLSACSLHSSKNDDIIQDVDGNAYKVVQIGDQTWMAENLRTTRFRDGSPIANVINEMEWKFTKSPAWVYYENNSDNDTIYGKLYNWYAVNDKRGICPEGWNVPDEASWNQLDSYLGRNMASKLKTTGTEYWGSTNTRSTNETGFSALPGGIRSSDGKFSSENIWGYWWSYTSTGNETAYNYILAAVYEDSYNWMMGHYRHAINHPKNSGQSIRCLKDSEPTAAYYIEYANIYEIKGNYHGQVEMLNNAILLDPKNPEILHRRAGAKVAASDYKGAIDDYSKVIELKHDKSMVYGGRAFAKWEMGNHQAALDDIDKLIMYGDGEAKAIGYIFKAQFNMELENIEKALSAINTGLSLAYQHIDNEADIADFYSLRGDVKLHMQDIEGMYNDFSRALELNPNEIEFIFKRGLLLKMSGFYEDAIDDFERAIQLKPFQREVVGAYVNVGLCYYQLGNHSAACMNWNIATQLGDQEANQLIMHYCN